MWRGANSLVSKLEASNFPFLVLLLLIGTPAAAQSWEVANRGMNTNLRGVSVASSSGEKGAPIAAVWTSGSQGVIVRSFDEGKSWHRLYVPGGDALDFRGIVAFGASLAYVISSGEGVKSRIYKTTDGGKTWKLEFTDNRKEFFLDSIACRSAKECFALGDPINGQFLLLETTDGEHWNPLPGGHMPAALPGEGAFAQVIPRSHLLVTRKFSSRPAALRLASFTRTTEGAIGRSRKRPLLTATFLPGFFPSRPMATTMSWWSEETTSRPGKASARLPILWTQARPGNLLPGNLAGFARLWHRLPAVTGSPSDRQAKTAATITEFTGNKPAPSTSTPWPSSIGSMAGPPALKA